MAIKLNLSRKEILEKTFAKVWSGYDADAVDQFLDKIMEDYVHYDQKISLLNKENDHLKTELTSAKKEITKLSESNEVLSKERESLEKQGYYNMSSLNRINYLEKNMHNLHNNMSEVSNKLSRVLDEKASTSKYKDNNSTTQDF